MVRTVFLSALLVATAAWPCSGEVCSDESEFSTLGGGVPVNLQTLVVRNVWGSLAGETRLFSSDGGLVPTQVRRGAPNSLFVEPQLALREGESYVLHHQGTCGALEDGGAHVAPFTVIPAVDVTTPLLAVRLADAGVADVLQYGGAACSLPVRSSFAHFRFEIDPARAALLPFVGWALSLEPLDGGAAVPWREEGVGAVLADGGLARIWNPQLAPPRLLQVWHACPNADAGFTPNPGAPAGTFRARLVGRFAGSDAGLDAFSEPFELTDCGAAAVVDAGTGTDGGSTSPPPPVGCSTAGLSFVALSALLVRRRAKR